MSLADDIGVRPDGRLADPLRIITTSRLPSLFAYFVYVLSDRLEVKPKTNLKNFQEAQDKWQREMVEELPARSTPPSRAFISRALESFASHMAASDCVLFEAIGQGDPEHQRLVETYASAYLTLDVVAFLHGAIRNQLLGAQPFVVACTLVHWKVMLLEPILRRVAADPSAAAHYADAEMLGLPDFPQ